MHFFFRTLKYMASFSCPTFYRKVSDVCQPLFFQGETGDYGASFAEFCNN